MRRWLASFLALALVLAGMVAPVAKQDVTVELFYSSAWHDVTDRVYTRHQITINHGAGNEQTGVVPSDASLAFRNYDGEMNPDNRKGSLFGLIGRNTPIRISVGSDIRFSGQVVSWKPRRAPGGLSSTRGDAWVEIKAQGTIRRLGQGEPPIQSAMFRSLSGVAAGDYVPHEYWPGEDSSDSTTIASAIAGRSPVAPSGTVTYASDGPAGSQPLLQASSGFKVQLPISPYTDTGKWIISLAVNVPAEPAATTVLMEVPVEGGTMAYWRLSLVPGANAELRWTAYSSAGTELFHEFYAFGTGFNPSEAQFFGSWYLITVGSEQDGTDLLSWLGYSDGATPGNPYSQLGSGTEASTTHGSLTDRLLINIDSNLDGVGIGHVVVFTDTDFDPFLDGLAHAKSLVGWTGETAGERFERLCAEQAISSTIVGDADETQEMGPQYPDTFLNLLDETARTDAGIIHDTRDELGLTLRTGRSLLNQDPAVTLDFEEGHIGVPLEPDIDDFGRINVVIASRRNGSKATASDEAGSLGTAAIGAYRSQVDLNPETDDVLPLHANYHLVLGTDPDPRYPQVVVDLDANPDLVGDVAAVDIGDLLGLGSIPVDLGQATADLLTLGYTEVIGSHRRVITFNTRPGAILSHVGMLDGDAQACLQTAGAQLGAAITAEAVSFNVATTSYPAFTTSPPTGAQIAVADREVMTVTGINALSDTFTRTVAAGSWGTSTSGHTYTLSDASIGSVNGTQGVLALSTVNVEKNATVSLGEYGLVDLSTWLTLGVTPTGAPINWGVLLRYTDANNYYWADAQIATTGVITLRLLKRVAGAATQITTTTAPVSHSTTVPRVLRAMYDPSTGTFASRIWSSDAAEPATWQLSTTDTAVPAGTRAGVIARLMTGNTNVTPVSFLFDNLTVYTPQEFTVTRDPDQRVAHAATSSVSVYRPLRLTL